MLRPNSKEAVCIFIGDMVMRKSFRIFLRTREESASSGFIGMIFIGIKMVDISHRKVQL
jgi:hypothetical protein